MLLHETAFVVHLYAHRISLAAQLNVQMHMSLSGVDYFGSDVGGFRREAADADPNEIYTQWFATSGARVTSRTRLANPSSVPESSRLLSSAQVTLASFTLQLRRYKGHRGRCAGAEWNRLGSLTLTHEAAQHDPAVVELSRTVAFLYLE